MKSKIFTRFNFITKKPFSQEKNFQQNVQIKQVNTNKTYL